MTVGGKAADETTRKSKKNKAHSRTRVPATISFSPDAYGTLKKIAKDKKVSLAWVVREAVDTYLSEKWPLFKE